MSFTEQERNRLAALADILIPATRDHLSASQADVAGGGLDQVLATGPEVANGLREILAMTVQANAAAAVADLREKNGIAFGILCEFAAGAYFLNPAVREAIGYAGQTARAIDPHTDYLDDGLLESVIQRGPIYRPTEK